MTINTERLQGTLDFITNNPGRHSQGIWFRGQATECGSTGCFAGWSVALYGPAEGWVQDSPESPRDFGPSYWRHEKAMERAMHVGEVAIDLLGLTQDQADVLFNGENTPGMIADMVDDLVNRCGLQHDPDEGDFNPWYYYQRRDHARNGGSCND